MAKRKDNDTPVGSFAVGAVALVFLIIGYQVALFINRAASLKLAANRDTPDTVYVVEREVAEKILATETSLPKEGPVKLRKTHSRPSVAGVPAAKRKTESFPFNPNTVSEEDLVRLGFSQKQAASIAAYREKGGRFRRKTDFAASYVVADSVYRRLEPFIEIPRTDINRADSLELLSLPGIGPWFASRIISYREALRGFSYKEQLMEIYRFDREKFLGLEDLIECSAPEPYPLWTLPEEELSKHPYINAREAHGIVIYRQYNKGDLSIEGLQKNGVLSGEHAAKLGKIRLSPEP